MKRKLAYHEEKCDGMVTIDFYVNGKRVEAFFTDGDIGSTKRVYSLEKRGNQYVIIEKEDLSTALDSSMGKNPPKTKTRKTKTNNRRQALLAMIKHIVTPYEEVAFCSFVTDPTKLKKGLERTLIGEPILKK